MSVLYCKNGSVIATHEKSQNVPSTAYGDSVYLIERAEGTAGLNIDQSNGLYIAPELDLMQYTLNLRWNLEVGGMDFNGMKVATDDRSKLLISGAVAAATRNANYVTKWNGTTALDATTILAIGDALADFVNDLFNKQGIAIEGIEAGNITTIEQIDEIFES